MIGKIPVLTPKECNDIIESIKDESWRAGVSGGDLYKEKIKQNLEIYPADSEVVDKTIRSIGNKILKNKEFARKVMPKSLGAPRFNLCQDGGHYKRHSDSAFMSNPEIRTDISMTLFLSDPNSYEGGELVLKHHYGTEVAIKDQQGILVFYPSGIPHEVTPVTNGQRFCMVSWVQSHIQDSKKREIASQVTILCDDMEKSEETNLSETHLKLLSIKHNLLRLWLEF